MSNMEKRLWIHPVIMNHHVPPCDPVSFCFPGVDKSRPIWVCLTIRAPQNSSKWDSYSTKHRQICVFVKVPFLSTFVEEFQHLDITSLASLFNVLSFSKSKNTASRGKELCGAVVFFDGALGWWLCGKATLTLASRNTRTILRMENNRNPWSCLWMLDHQHSTNQFEAWPRYRYTFSDLGWESHSVQLGLVPGTSSYATIEKDKQLMNLSNLPHLPKLCFETLLADVGIRWSTKFSSGLFLSAKKWSYWWLLILDGVWIKHRPNQTKCMYN